jgi:hypothetical protein
MKSLADILGVPDPQQPDAPVVPFELDLLSPDAAQTFSIEVLNSAQYRESLLRRILMDELPAAVECKLMDYAWGKPVERVEHTGKNGGPIVNRVERVIIDSVDPEVLTTDSKARHGPDVTH